MQVQRQSMNQLQKYAMNPQMYQSIKVMEMQVIDLKEKIEEELEKNPALEVLRENRYMDSKKAAYSSPENDRQSFIEGTLSNRETLQDHLLWQLRLEPLDGNTRRLGEYLIQNLDEDGFHKEPVEVLCRDEDPCNVKKAMEVVQGLDPVGTCTSDYLESLKVQIEHLANPPRGIKKALSCLDLLEKGKTAEAARIINCTKNEAEKIFARIKELSPFPGRRFASGSTRFIVPDIQVIKKEGEFVIILNEEEIPVLGINPFFMKVASGSDLSGDKRRAGEKMDKESKPVRDFARENINEARWFINSINQRNHTLLRVSRAIVEFQRPFFSSGPKYLTPLLLKDISGELGLHKATVSRVANGKYMQTEWGIFELRHFFSNSISGPGSRPSRYSKGGVKEIIREIIDSGEDRLSDQNIMDLLHKRGIRMARRTVAKYRNELELGSSFNR